MTSPPVLALDAMGVIYDHGDDVNELLVPYVRSLGCTLTEDEINAYYIQCSLGRTTSTQLWGELGVANRANDIDYVSRHRLTPGVMDVLRMAKTREWTLACLSNDVAEWSLLLRRRFVLEGLITEWVFQEKASFLLMIARRICSAPMPQVGSASHMGIPPVKIFGISHVLPLCLTLRQFLRSFRFNAHSALLE